MPNIKKKLGKVVIDHPLGGWISAPEGLENTSTPLAALEGAENQYSYSSGTSLFRPGRLGQIAPGEAFDAMPDAGARCNALVLNGVSCTSGKIFMVQTNARLLRSDILTLSIDNKFDPTLAGAHAGHTIAATRDPDCITLFDTQTTPVEWVLWSWEDNTDGDVSCIKADSTGQVDGLFGAGPGVLMKGVPLKIAQGPDGNVYITNGQYIASMVLGANTALTSATLNKQALNLGSGWEATGIISYKNYIAVLGHKNKINTALTYENRSECRVWLWDGFSPDPNFIYNIPDNLAKGIFYSGEILRVITMGRGSTTKSWVFDGSDFVLEFLSGAFSIDTNALQGSLDQYQDSLIIGDSSGLFQVYKNSVHTRTILSDGTNTAIQIGLLKNLFANQLFAGVNYSSTYKVWTSNLSYYYPGAQWRSRLIELPYLSNIKKITLYFSQFGSGASLDVSLMHNYNTVAYGGGNDVLGLTLTNAVNGALASYESKKVIPRVNSFWINLRFSHASISDTAAIVRKIEIVYEPTDSP